MVYDIEKSWYQGNHPLTYTEHENLTKTHKKLLEDYRENCRREYHRLEQDEQRLSCDDVFSTRNMQLLLDFSSHVFEVSRQASNAFVNFSKEIILSSIEVLSKKELVAPCQFTVIALGSVAKGEATPYSDLEYAFIVESEDTYFTHLAVDSYFRIGNLCETPLSAFDIAELKDSDMLPLEKISTVGFRIDGIKRKAGNIPTGAVGGQRLMLTVDGFMELYKTSTLTPFDGVAGDKADLISCSKEIYSSQGNNSSLYNRLQQEIESYESSLPSRIVVYRKRLMSFAQDIKEYNYLPEYTKSLSAWSEHVKVKTHIFRYPTLLVNNLRICLSMLSLTSWETIQRLRSAEMVSEENHRYLQIVLALSIYIRAKAYIDQRSQTETVSLYTSAEKEKKLYYVPQNLFIILGCILVPVKHCIHSCFRQCFDELSQGTSMQDVVKKLLNEIVVDREDFMLKVELFSFVENFVGALQTLNRKVENIESFDCERFRKLIREKYNTTKDDDLEYRYLQIVARVLRRNEKLASTVDFCSWLVQYVTRYEDIAKWKVYTADCMFEMGNTKSAKRRLNEAVKLFKQSLRLAADGDVLQYLQFGNRHHMQNLDICRELAAAYDLLGSVQREEKCYEEALDSLDYSLSICCGLLRTHLKLAGHERQLPISNIECLSRCIQTIEVSQCSHDVRFCLENSSCICNAIWSVRYNQNDLKTSLTYANLSLDINQLLYGASTNHIAIATNYNNIGSLYCSMNDYQKAIDFHNKSLNMMKALYGADTNHPDTASSHHNIGAAYSSKADYKTALDHYQRSLEMRCSLPMTKTNIANISRCYTAMGCLYMMIDRHSDASTCYSQALVGSVRCGKDGITSLVLIRLSELLRTQSFHSCKFGLQFLKIVLKSNRADEIKYEAFHHLGKCYTRTRSWKKSWRCLYIALCGYQSLPHCKPSTLAGIHLSIGELLFHVGNISQSLEQLEIAHESCAENTKLYKVICLYIDTLRLVKICQHSFYGERL